MFSGLLTVNQVLAGLAEGLNAYKYMTSVHFTFLYCLGHRAESAESQRPGTRGIGTSEDQVQREPGLQSVMVTTWCNLQPVSVSRYQECVTEAVYLVIDTPLQSEIIWPPTFIFAE